MAWALLGLFQILGGFVTGAVFAAISTIVGIEVMCEDFPFGGFIWDMWEWESRCGEALWSAGGTFEQAMMGLAVVGFVIGSPLGVYLVSRSNSQKGAFWLAFSGSVLGGGATLFLLQLTEGVGSAVYVMILLLPVCATLGFNLPETVSGSKKGVVMTLLGLAVILIALFGALLLGPGAGKDGVGRTAESRAPEIERLPKGCPPSCSGADLDGAYLRGVDLNGADLSGAALRAVNLSEANLQNANLRGADVSTEPFGDFVTIADLRRTDLRRADLSGANLHSALLDDADLSFSNLSGANLRLAHLRRANLSGANLSGADLYYAGLQGATVSPAQLAAAKSLEGTVMPDGTRHE